MLSRYYVQFFLIIATGAPVRYGKRRYKATLIDIEAYLLTCMRYIELNPIRAGVVAHPSEYPCSSYGCNALDQTDNLVNPHPLSRRLGRTDKERRRAYQQLFEYPISEKSINAIREATNKVWVLGNDLFKQSIQEKLKRRVAPVAKGGDRRSEQFKINLL